MNRCLWLLMAALWSLGTLAVHAQQLAPVVPSSDVDSDMTAAGGFTLIPKAFQRNPTLEMTAYTTVTVYGRGFNAATPDAPQYYELSGKGRVDRGMALAGESPPSPEELLAVLQRSLAAAGYRPADAGHPAQVGLVWYWGSDTSGNQIGRALLIGGRPYGLKIWRELMNGETDYSVSGKKEYLRAQVAEDLHFLVVSAYAMADIAEKYPKLLWRTTMTVNTRGVSMRESLPPLVLSARDYFGRATTESVALRRAVRRGTVKLGPMQVLDSDVPASMAAPGK